METTGQWLEKALMDLCQRVETGLGMGLDKDMISGLVSYCELADPVDAKEYLDNIIGQEAGKSVIEEYLQRRGHPKMHNAQHVPELHAYVKAPSDEASLSGTNKPLKGGKTVTASVQQTEPRKHVSLNNQGNKILNEQTEPRNTQKGNQSNSKKKKAGKVISLAEAAKGSIVFKQGRPCTCQARRHRLVSNCLSCGKIVCEQEGEGPCHFCGALVLREGSNYAGLDETLPLISDAEAVAEAYTKRLVEYDRNSAARTTVIDDQSDYYEIEGNSWLSNEEKELLKKKQEEIEEAEKAKRNRVTVTFDLVGRKVMVNEDEVSESQSASGILRPPDERELLRIKPSPNLKIHPIFIDPGTSTKPAKAQQVNKGLSKGLCLEITGRVQHESKDLKHLVSGKQMTTASNEEFWQVPSVNGGGKLVDDSECFLGYR